MVRITSLVVILLLAAACFLCVSAQECAGPIPKAEAKLDSHHPSLNQSASAFTGNTLYAMILSPMVQNRTYINVTFVGAENTRCHIDQVSSVWEQGESGCKDKFELALSWDLHNACGIKRQNVSDLLVQYHGIILMSYEDSFDFDAGDTEEIPLQIIKRRSTVSFDIFIRFPRIVSVMVEEILIKSEVNVTGVVSEFLYDSDAKLANIEITTVVQYPNRLVIDGAHLFLPNDITVASGPTLANPSCPFDHGYCKQTFRFAAPLTADCDFDGSFSYNITVVTCRDADYSQCTRGVALVEFRISGSKVCGSVDTKPYLDGVLTAHRTQPAPAPAAAPEAETQFLIGEQAWFLTTILTEDNDATMKYKDIWLTVDGEADSSIPLYVEGVRTQNGTLAALQFKGTDARLFSIIFTTDAFRVAPMSYLFYTVHARVQVDFADNRKREVVEFRSQGKSKTFHATSSKDAAFNTFTKVGLSYEEATAAAVAPESTPVPTANSLSTNMMMSIVGIAVVVVAAAIVAAVVIVKKSQNSYSKL